MLARYALILAAALPLLATPAAAASCTLALSAPGVLALSGDATRFASTEVGGAPATVAIGSIGTNTVTISAPTLTAYPPGFDPGSASLSLSYQGTGVLAGISQPYTSQPSSFEVPGLLGTVILNLNNRITASAGFSAGEYRTRTVLTCS